MGLNRFETVSLVVFISVFVLTLIYVSTGLFSEHFGKLVEYIHENQYEGAAIMILAITIACTVPSPAFLLIIACGYCFESPLIGFCVAYIGTLCGSVCNYAVSNLLLKDIVVKYVIEGYPLFGMINKVVTRRGFLLTFLLRLPFTPFAKMSNVLSCTSMSFRDYALGTALGVAFPVALMVGLGSGLGSVGDDTELPGWFIVAAVVGVIGVLLGVGWYAHVLMEREIAKMENEEDSGTEEGDTSTDPLIKTS